MIDFHSHILPDFDDGAKDIETSLEMLKKSYEDGVKTVVSTSHCYAKSQNGLDYFLGKRSYRWKKLNHELENKENMPRIIKAAEVNLNADCTAFEHIEKLAIEGTNYILVEMPTKKWTEDIIEVVYSITVKGLRPILAHIDRYMWAKKEFSNFSGMDVLFQINADCFLTGAGRQIALELISSGYGHVIGSDMHDLKKRPSNIKKAYGIIGKKFGQEYVEFFKANGEAVLNNESIDKYRATEFTKPKKLSLMF